MYQSKINKTLCEKMPYLIVRNIWTNEISEDYDYSYIIGDDLPKGWKRLFLQMCEDIREPLIKADLLNTFRFLQVKEKYGAMRCYHFGASKEVIDIIHKYEHISGYVCEKCGKPATKMTCGWISVYCDECCPKNHDIKRIKFRPLIDEINIWERYLKNESVSND